MIALVAALVGVAPGAIAQEAPPTTAAPAPPTTAVAATTVPEGQVPPPPTLTVAPDTGLVDGQVVAISGSGWGNPVGPQFCGEELGDTSQTCVDVGSVEAGADGELHGSASLPARFTRPDGGIVDCFEQQCRVHVSEYRGNGQVALVSFSGVIPATPAFTG